MGKEWESKGKHRGMREHETNKRKQTKIWLCQNFKILSIKGHILDLKNASECNLSSFIPNCLILNETKS